MLFKDVNLELLSRVLDAAALRHKVVANNIANVNTPGYRRWEVRFQDALQQAVRSGDPEQALSIRPRVVKPNEPSSRLDGNNVDLEREYATLTNNAALFNTVAQIIGMRLAAYRAAIGADQDSQ